MKELDEPFLYYYFYYARKISSHYSSIQSPNTELLNIHWQNTKYHLNFILNIRNYFPFCRNIN